VVERLLRLVSLLGSNPASTGAELAESLQITLRTVRRDIQLLREIGYPVVSRSGKAGGGYRLDGQKTMPTLDRTAIAKAVRQLAAARHALGGRRFP
jgi:predicted DNA-binding transcriptional regulator YafY